MKKIGYAAYMLSISAALLTAGCSNDSDEERTKQAEPVKIPLTEETRAVVETGNSFSLDLLSTVAESENGNFVISPFSAFMTAAMLANGDTGLSRDQIMRAMGLEGTETDLATLNEYCKSLSSFLPKVDGKVTCSLANGAWIDPEERFLDTFSGVLSDSFGAECRNIAPGGEKGRADINHWVSGKTSGMIPEFLKEPLEEGTMFAIVNAVYFNGEWQKRFNKAKTGTAIFHNADGSESDHMQMVYSGKAGWLQTDDYTSVSLKYGNGNFEMVLAVPNDGNEHMLSRERLQHWQSELGNMMTADMELRMPRFEVESDLDLINALKGMGIVAPFDRNQGLHSISSVPQYLKVYQQGVKIKVDEDESEAASATIAAGTDLSAGKFELTIDRPFIFLVRETTTGAILFAGRVTKL